MQKCNYETKRYEDYTVPDNWKVAKNSIDMFEKMNCAVCGKSMCYGYGFMSRTICDGYGIRYVVCKDCHNKEIKEEEEYICESLNKAMGWPAKESLENVDKKSE